MKGFKSINELSAYEEGYATAIDDFLRELDDSKFKILTMMLDTEPFTSQRRMLLACDKLLKIYSRHYQRKLNRITSEGVDMPALL